MKHSLKKNDGQVMLLSAVILGGVLIGATTIAAILVIFQIRGSNDAVNSTKAFFAADAALERQTYLTLKGELVYPLVFSDEAVSATSSTKIVPPSNIQIRSQGFSGRTVRALETIFSSE